MRHPNSNDDDIDNMQIQLSKRISQTGAYAFAEVDKKVAELKEKGVKVIDFGVGDPSDATPDFVIDALYASAKKYNKSGYPSYIGNEDFRKACASYMKDNFNVELDPDTEITSTIGSKEAVFNFPLSFVDPGDIVICPTPGYPPYKSGSRFAGGEVYFVPLLEENDFLIDFELIPADIAQRAKVIWINYPNSPTGKAAPRAWLEKFVEWAQKNNIIIAADEGCYIDIYFNEKPISILEVAREGVITFYSLSKRNNMTGYRVGFCAGDERVIGAFKKVKTNIDSGTPDFVQGAAIVALQDNEHAQVMRDVYKNRREKIINALTNAGLPEIKGDATFYLWQKAPEGMTGIELAEKFLELGIVVTPGAWISDVTESGVNPGVNYVRFALVASDEQIDEAVLRISDLKV